MTRGHGALEARRAHTSATLTRRTLAHTLARTLPVDATQTSRGRLLAAGRTLFSRNGYEQTSTASIARSAGSSESQLVRYFGGKSGLLEAIFDEAWSSLADAIARETADAPNGRMAILSLLRLFVESFSRQQDVAYLFLFEGRRLRGREVALSKGFIHFTVC